MFGRNSKNKMATQNLVESSSSSPEYIEKQEKLRNILTKELETVVKAAISSPYSSRENIPSEITQNICNAIEAIFIHGLRDPFFLKGTRYSKYPEPNFWPFVSKYSHRNVTKQINSLNQINNEIGKGRAWIRIVLNENSLSQYLDLLASEKSAINQFYGNYAFLRYLSDNEYSEQIRGILKPLTTIPIYAATNSSFLNRWTPTPLILAGLSSGDPLKVGALAPRRNPRADSVSEEIAVSALDMLVPEEDHDIGSPNRLTKRRRQYSKTYTNKSEEDETSSVYSHPSMLDAGEMSYQHALLSRKHPSSSTFRPSSSSHRIQLPQSPLFTSTPIEKTILDNVAPPTTSGPVNVVSYQTSQAQLPENYAPIVVSRLTKRPRKNTKSRSSSESTSRDGKSRANSDMPSTIFGTVPNDVAFSIENTPIHVSETVDSGICESSEDKKYEDEKKNEEEEEKNEQSTTTFLEAIEQLNAISQQKIDDSEQQNEVEPEKSEESKEIEVDVFEVELETVEVKDNSKMEENETQKNIEEEEDSMLEPQRQSILGTSLHDELLNALPSVEQETFEQGIPIYVQSPHVMGNSLQAIGARNHIGSWDTMSERSSSDSCGPIMSFGQALRSAMDNRIDDHFDESGCTSPHNTDYDESICESSNCSRKPSTITSEIEEKLCTIARERGLDSQDFRCAMCTRTIGGSTFSKFE
ncbi:unnamed protein product [Caenorhabditis angaria]|uniref:RUN domain-containing protein n=1 Tax=Caenorhabditis angaria TaxID=860376 RepID=A0A9P1IBX9_9PELO|nr:unnamed protein product [Caenorhabditis angaria]